MTALFFVVSLSVINILLWIVFLVKFKRLFSTEDIIASTRDEMNKMIADVNRNTERDISLINDRIKELKAIIADADRHLAVARTEKEKNEKYAEFTEKIASASSVKNSQPSPAQKAAEQYRKTARTFDVGNMAYSVNHEQPAGVIQESLFDEQPTSITVKPDGSSYAKVPVVGPEVVMAENPVVPKKDFNEQVRLLYERGEGVEDIARELKCSTTEVSFALDMGL